jgi:RHS repeat-associated protein
VEQTVQYYDYGQTNLLETVTKGWQDQFRLGCRLETHDGSGLSGTFYSYGPGLSLTAEEEYDYGQISSTSECPQAPGGGPITAPSGWLRQTATAYQVFTNTPINYIGDRPCQVITYGSTGTNRVAETDYYYDNGATTTPCGAAGTPSVTGAGGSTLTGHDETNYSASSTDQRGNLTQKTQWLNTGTSPFTTYTYDETGQVLSMTDPKTNQTSYSYADSFLNTNSSGFTTTAGSPPSGKVTNAYLTKVTDPTTNGVAHIEKFSYGYNDGELTQSTDENSQPTTYKYNDSLSRQTETDFPDTGETTLSYNDTAPTPSVTTTKLITSSLNLSTTAIMDGLGHVTRTQLTTDPDGTTYTATAYDGTGKSYQVYNPTRCSPPTTNCGTETTWGFSTYTYDGLGRTKTVAEPDGSAVTTSYSAKCTTVTDEVGVSRQSCADGLGRMTSVVEAPNNSNYGFLTTYAYDLLNDLTRVTQNGNNSSNARVRTFTYDSLSRLLCAANPEVKIVTCPSSATGTFPTGAITYSYDLNGNLLSKVAPQPSQTGTAQTTTNYGYDALNRLTWKTYLYPASAEVQYGYDGAVLSGCSTAVPSITSPTNLIGRRSAMCWGNSSSAFSYDPMGRPSVEARANSGSSVQQYTAGYTYFKDGSLDTLTYPSGDVLTYTVGGAGRATQVSDPSNNFVGYSGNTATYAPQGALATMANGYTNTTTYYIETGNLYNDRLQPILIQATLATGGDNAVGYVLSLCYDFHLHVAVSTIPCSFDAYTTGDNGNVFQVLNNADSTRSTAYIYDPLNRIAQAYTETTSGANCWGETYSPMATAPGVLPSTPGIDAWGNLTNRSGVTGMGSCQTEGLSATATAQNQLSGIGLVYDAAGNVTTDNLGNTYTYDAENRIATVAGYTYSYDADGTRMEKADGSSGTMYWFGPGSEVLTESSLTGTINEEYVYFNGQRIARVDRPSGTVNYYFSNHLGSASVITSATGVIQEQTDFFPYGGVAYVSGGDPNHYKFTGKERDAESGLDNFEARYLGSSLGRFMSPDPAGLLAQKPGYPQSWNLYAYAMNNPLIIIDPTGLDCVYANDAGNGVESIDHDSNSGECGSNGGTWAPGYVDENWSTFNQKTQMFQVGSVDGAGSNATIDYTNFAAGAQTNDNGNCLSGCSGYGFASANANWLQSQLVGNSMLGGLDGYIQFLTGRQTPLQGGLLMQLAAGPLDPSTDHWAGPGGMGPPGGRGDWAASVHDYNFMTNDIKISSYFNPTLKLATANALIKSNNTLMRNAGGVQSVKMFLFFGPSNALQWYANSWK